MQMRCKEETAKGAYLWGHPEGDKHFGFAQVIADSEDTLRVISFTVEAHRGND